MVPEFSSPFRFTDTPDTTGSARSAFRPWGIGMTTVKRMRRAVRWLAAAGLLALPACSALDTVEPPDRAPLPPTLAARAARPSRAAPTVVSVGGEVEARADEKDAPPRKPAFTLPATPAVGTQGKPLPINLPTALALSDANPLDIQIAGERLRAADAQFDRAKVLWLPNVGVGVDYFRHDGQIQDVSGIVFHTRKSAFLVGAGPTAVFSVGDALYAPLAARQIARARRADVEAVRNDTTLAVAEAYFTVQQARGEVAGSIEALRRAEELVKLTEQLAPELTPTAEVNRARTETARRRQAVEAAYERWQVASAELTRILRLEPGTLVEPAEEPALAVELFDPATNPDDLIPIALTYRPELASDQAAIQAALALVRQEKVRPFVPNISVQGVGSQVPGLAGGYFGGGLNGNVGNFGGRFSLDLQAVWTIQNLGYGNRANIRGREAEERQALLQLLRTQDRVTAEVVQAHAQLRRAANRVKAAADGVADATETAEKNLRGLVPGKKVADRLGLVFRPQEAVAAVTALDQAYRDYYAAVADHNRAQFRLYRALGHPARCLTGAAAPPATAPATGVPVPMSAPAVPAPQLLSGSRPAADSPQPTAPVSVPPSPANRPIRRNTWAPPPNAPPDF
jgi:outer membrane protein TolC